MTIYKINIAMIFSVFKPGTEVCKESNKELYYDAKRINFDDYID